MEYIIRPPGFLKAKIHLPASKSISNRVLVLNALSRSPYNIENLSDCDDTRVMLKAFTQSSKEINVQAAGTAMRFLTAFLAIQEGEYILTGTERMKNRPIAILVDALRQLGADIEYVEKNGFPPLKITGKALKGGKTRINGSISSQYISALMMIAPCMEEGLTIELEGGLISEPYVNMTEKLMELFGAIVSHDEHQIRIESQNYHPRPFSVESDWSAASYWYELLSLAPENSEVELLGLSSESLQGDSAIARLFESLGIKTEYTDWGVRLQKTKKLAETMECDCVNEPDLAQTLALTCALKNIPFCFSGLQSLKIKETDRIKALQNEAAKLGYVFISENDRILKWTGKRQPIRTKPVIETYDDHRMAMSFAPAAWVTGEMIIKDPLVVTKSYPEFWNHLIQSGFKITEADSGEICCGQHESCEKQLKILRTEIEYYDDDELDVYRGKKPDEYSDEEVSLFREILYTMLVSDIPGWLQSLQMRGVELPSVLKNEALALWNEK